MADLKAFLRKLHENLNILREREAKYGSNAPLDLLNQIDDHQKAIVLTEQAIAGELSQAELHEALKPLLVEIASRTGEAASSVTIGDIEGDIHDSTIAGGDVVGRDKVGGDKVGRDKVIIETVIINYPPLPLPTITESDTSAIAEPILDCPYRGLFAFRPEHAHLFFGRETFTKKLVEAVESQPFVTLLGASGSGKSSVVFAGLVPALLNQTSESWLFTTFRPGDDPFLGLASALVPLLEPDLGKIKQIGEARDLAARLRGERSPLSDYLNSIHQTHPDQRLLIIADQFEELYTQCRDTEARQQFLVLLLDLIKAVQGVSPRLVLTLRADFLGQVSLYAPFAEIMNQIEATKILGPMTRAEMTEAIEKPASRQKISFEANLVDRLLNDVGEGEGSLPLLEFALTELWQHQHQRTLTHVAYEEIGKINGALSRHADKAFQGLTPAEQEQARQIFVQLVNPGIGTQDTRRLATRAELGLNWSLVTKLANERLVVTNQIENEPETVEVVHEALIHNWQQLRVWMEQDREFLAWRLSLRGDLKRWERVGHDEGALLRGVPLAIAREKLAERRDDLTPPEQDYIQASVDLDAKEAAEKDARHQRELEIALKWAKEAEARHQAEVKRAEEQAQAARRLRRLTLGLAVALLLALVTTFFAFWQSNIATARQLATNSLVAFAQGKFYLATLLALEANKLNPGEGSDILAQIPYHAQYIKGFTLEGHAIVVSSVAWQPNGRYLASGSYDGRVIIWDGESGQKVATLEDLTSVVSSVAWQPDGRRLASGWEGGRIIIWDVESWQKVITLEGDTGSGVQSIAWQPDGRLASLSWDSQIIIWDVESGQKVTTLERDRDTGGFSVAWQPNGRYLASVSHDGGVIISDVESGQKVITLEGDSGRFFSVAWQPDGRRLASGSVDDGRIIIWDVESWQKVITLEGDSGSGVQSMAWQPDGRLASGLGDGRIIIWDVESGQKVTTLEGDSGSGVQSMAWQPDGRLASGLNDGRIIIWDVKSWQKVTTLEGDTGRIFSLAWQPDGRLASLSSVSVDSGRIIIWDVESGQKVTTLEVDKGRVFGVAWQPDGRRFALVSYDDQIIIWDVESRQKVTTLEVDRVFGVAWQPDGRYLALISNDRRIIIWDVESGQKVTTLEGDTDSGVQRLAWQPDGRLASVSFDGQLIIWDVESGQKVTTLEMDTVSIGYMAWQPDGRYLALMSNDRRSTPTPGLGLGQLIIWDVESWQKVTTLEGSIGSKVLSVAWQPDGHRLASGWDDGRVIIWDVESWQKITTLEEDTSMVSSLAWQPDGHYLALGSVDKIELLPEEFIHPPCQWLISNLSVSEWLEYRGLAIYQPTCDNLQSPQISLQDSLQHPKKLFLTLQGRLLLAGGTVLILGLIVLMMWGSFKRVRLDIPRIFSK